MDISETLNFAVDFLSKMGYIGVVGIMALESTFLPIIIPSELFLISYGAAAYKGDMSIILVILSASFGILLGSLMNYYTSAWLGRAVLYKYGKYIFLSTERMQFWEVKFLKYSKFLIFFGRFVPLPAIKHLITIPAGLSKMNIKMFCFLTTFGGGIFSTIVVIVGYWFGKKAETMENYSSLMNKFLFYSIGLVAFVFVVYKIYKIFAKKHK